MPASSTFHGVEYNEKKQKQGSAQMVHFENFGHLQDGRTSITKNEFKKYFESYSNRNTRTRKPQFHAMLSCKGKSSSHEQLKDQALIIMDKMGYANVPILIYAHKDTENNHVHIVTSRIAQNGKKISDSFEKKRAAEILTKILNINTAQVFKNDLEIALSYHFSTVPQLLMLMENTGYTVQDRNNILSFFKHGKEQGQIDKTLVEEKIEVGKQIAKSTERLRALIYKYASNYSSILSLENSTGFTSAKPKFASDLTHFLKNRFGFEFVFFLGKNQAKPYGYAIIDHNSKLIYKGSEIMKLEQLINLSKEEKYEEQKIAIPDNIKQTEKPAIHQQERLFETTQIPIKHNLPIVRDTGSAETSNQKKKRRGRFF